MRSAICFAFLALGLAPAANAKRTAPQPVTPVLNAGLRFEAIHWATKNETKQNGGFIRVVNIRNGLPICTKQVYETKYDLNLEKDVQDNFITKLYIKEKVLVISSEKLADIEKPLANFCD
jgi:hypothetical protein